MAKSKFIRDVDEALANGSLTQPFSARAVQRVCYGVFLS